MKLRFCYCKVKTLGILPKFFLKMVPVQALSKYQHCFVVFPKKLLNTLPVQQRALSSFLKRSFNESRTCSLVMMANFPDRFSQNCLASSQASLLLLTRQTTPFGPGFQAWCFNELTVGGIKTDVYGVKKKTTKEKYRQKYCIK